ncbi:hypothetical protein [Meridianimarinicoccus marinus]
MNRATVGQPEPFLPMLRSERTGNLPTFQTFAADAKFHGSRW